MQTSTRNQFSGIISDITRGVVNSEVNVAIGNGFSIVSVITNGSAERLGLTEGKAVMVLIKASSVILAVAGSDRTSARNQFCGRVVHCQEGTVSGEVGIELPGGLIITAIITNESLRKLGISKNVDICALVKASSPIIAVPV